MRLKPRHYVLCAVIIAIFVVNIVRNHHRQTITSTPAAPIVTGPRVITPLWTSFDTAASLRDAPDAQFLPALHSLQQLLDTTHDNTTSAVDGCHTWLLFYRQAVIHPSKDPTWKDRSAHHIDGCVKYHLDLGL